MANELTKIEIEPSTNGGHIVTHRMKAKMRLDLRSHSGVSQYVEPEQHVFGKDEGHEMLRHLAEHLTIAEPKGAKEEDEEDDEDTADED